MRGRWVARNITSSVNQWRKTMTLRARHELRWNWPHLAALVGLVPFAWLAGIAAWEPGTTLTLGTLLALAWLMFAERRWPARPEWASNAQELLRDGVFLGINAVVDAAGALLLTWLALAWATAMPGPAANWSPWIAVPIAVVLGELGPYVLHRWAHRGGWGWRVHAVHHAPRRMHASNNLTTHPINVLWNQMARMLPWIALGFEAHVIAWSALFIQVQSFAVHANISGTVGPLSRWIGSAELHRWHHSVVQKEALNFSTAVPIWDRLFGTYQAPSVYGPAHVGIADLPVDVGGTLWRKMLLAPICSRCA
jgi:sterol desaturase/sphingolipid hydroxylase (fatty acid hydroxylase superfamily)